MTWTTTTGTSNTTNGLANYLVVPSHTSDLVANYLAPYTSTTTITPYTFSGGTTAITSNIYYLPTTITTTGTGPYWSGANWTVPYVEPYLEYQREQTSVISVPAIPRIEVGETWTAWNERYAEELAAHLARIAAATPPSLSVSPEEEKRRAARKTARETLLTLLDAPQAAQLERESCFELRVDDRLYQIRPGNVVYRLDPATRKKLSHFCIHPSSAWMPEDDWAIAQKLLLEASEDEFLRIANRRDYA